MLRVWYDGEKMRYNVQLDFTVKPSGTYSVAIDFGNVKNIEVPEPYLATVRSGQTLLRLKPTSMTDSVDFTMRKHIVRGDYRAVPDHDFRYRLPFGFTGQAVPAERLPNLPADYFDDAEPDPGVFFRFGLSSGDTVYAARKGIVVDVVDTYDPDEVSYLSSNNLIVVEHADKTMACYYALAEGSPMVRTGQTVYPDTPLALAGNIDGEREGLVFCVCHLAARWFEPGSPFVAERAFIRKCVDPLFATDKGAVRLTAGKFYVPRVTEELITAEMSKKELKKRE